MEQKTKLLPQCTLSSIPPRASLLPRQAGCIGVKHRSRESIPTPRQKRKRKMNRCHSLKPRDSAPRVLMIAVQIMQSPPSITPHSNRSSLQARYRSLPRSADSGIFVAGVHVHCKRCSLSWLRYQTFSLKVQGFRKAHSRSLCFAFADHDWEDGRREPPHALPF